MNVRRGELLMLYFPIPGTGITYHPGVVVSSDGLFEAEEFFYAVMLSTKPHHPEFIFEIRPEMVTQANGKYPSFAKCHLLNTFKTRDIDRKIGYLKEPYLQQLTEKVIASVFHG